MTGYVTRLDVFNDRMWGQSKVISGLCDTGRRYTDPDAFAVSVPIDLDVRPGDMVEISVTVKAKRKDFTYENRL